MIESCEERYEAWIICSYKANRWTVPTFVTAHTFCASRKPWFKYARAGVDIDAINYATKCTTKIKVIPLKLFYYQTFLETWRNEHS